jgi:hypothetical protein
LWRTAVIYLKNKVTRSWEFNEEWPKIPAIPDDEKTILRERLVPTLASAPPNIRQQLLPLIGKVLHFDFPERWPSYMDITLQLLNSNDIGSVFAGVQCLLSLTRVYRFKRDSEKRDELDRVTAATFPLILAIGNRLVDETSTEAGDMLKMIIKTYKHAVYVGARMWRGAARFLGQRTEYFFIVRAGRAPAGRVVDCAVGNSVHQGCPEGAPGGVHA